MKKQFIILESDIMYDNDDFGLFADIVYNINDNKIMVEYYGHGVGPKYLNDDNQVFKLDYAIENNIIQENVIKTNLLNYLNFKTYISNIDFYRFNTEFNLPCAVIGGKFKTEKGILIKIIQRKCKSMNFGKLVNDKIEKAVVYFTDKNYIREINTNLVTLKLNNILCDNFINNIIKNTNIKLLTHLIAYSISYASCDKHLKNGNIIDIISQNCKDDDYIIPTDVKNLSEETRKQNQNKKLSEKRKDIEIWANQKFKGIKTEDEINEIIERTLKKYYS